jgi:uncharacterized protein YcsI (UPF0317 family)
MQASAATFDEGAARRGASLRSRMRSGEINRHTSGLADDLVQCNLVVLPEAEARDFLLYCQRNPKPCPVVAVSEVGDPSMPTLGTDIDLRTDLPRYRVWRHGELVSEPADVREVWRDDLVAFAIGCSFSFEWAMRTEGIRLRHIEQDRNVSMYRTDIATQRAGAFGGALVVSMRPLVAADAIRAIQITSRFPAVHGAPVHIGDPSRIGIRDLAQPEYGDAVEVLPHEIPVFWACGVTPQAALEQARPSLCITHAPGSMLITDLLNHQLASN